MVCWRAVLRRSWRQALALSLIGGLLGGVALASLAGARRTASTYGRYLQATNASDVAVNMPGEAPGVGYPGAIASIAALPGVASHAAFAGLSAFPVVHGKIDDSFLTPTSSAVSTGLTSARTSWSRWPASSRRRHRPPAWC